MGRGLTSTELGQRFAVAAHATNRPDRAVTEAAIAVLYRGAELPAPQIHWAPSPRQACLMADQTVGAIACDTFPGDRLVPRRATDDAPDEISHILLPWTPGGQPRGQRWASSDGFTGYPDALWHVVGFGHGLKTHPAHITSFRHEKFASDHERGALLGLVENVGWWRFHRSAVFLSERPRAITLDHLDRPHSTMGPAVTFDDGWSTYAVDGVRVPAWVVERPEQINVSDIDDVANAEVRRILAALVGDRYMESRGTPRHIDDWGELWSVEGIPGGFLKVTDATAGPDGTRKTYWLRVPETVVTAHEAVAWTFGLEPAGYNPDKET